MVKRQTVWLSTMMVLSLMLIGYYTMNSPTTPTAASDSTGSSPTVSSETTPPSTAASNSKGGTNTNSGSSSASDFFSTMQTTVEQNMSKQTTRLKAELANTNASPSQISQASAELGQIESIGAGLDNAAQAIKADGYKNAVIVPDVNNEKFTVYVETNSLQKDDAIKIMNIVSQQLNVSMLNISVKAHQ